MNSYLPDGRLTPLRTARGCAVEFFYRTPHQETLQEAAARQNQALQKAFATVSRQLAEDAAAGLGP